MPPATSSPAQHSKLRCGFLYGPRVCSHRRHRTAAVSCGEVFVATKSYRLVREHRKTRMSRCSTTGLLVTALEVRAMDVRNLGGQLGRSLRSVALNGRNPDIEHITGNEMPSCCREISSLSTFRLRFMKLSDDRQGDSLTSGYCKLQSLHGVMGHPRVSLSLEGSG